MATHPDEVINEYLDGIRKRYVNPFAFLAVGVMMVLTLPGTPCWFVVTDLMLAYLPMAYLGYKLGQR